MDRPSFVAAVYPFRVELAYTVQTKWKDPVGDDKGPLGAYRYPTHASFTNQNDIETVELSTAGTSLKVTVTMAGPLSTLWGPPNGFDHVAFYLYLQVPGQASATVLPFQNGQTPAGFSWSRMAFFEGWTSRLFRAEGAAPRSYGAPASPAGTVKADKAKQQITFTLDHVHVQRGQPGLPRFAFRHQGVSHHLGLHRPGGPQPSPGSRWW